MVTQWHTSGRRLRTLKEVGYFCRSVKYPSTLKTHLSQSQDSVTVKAFQQLCLVSCTFPTPVWVESSSARLHHCLSLPGLPMECSVSLIYFLLEWWEKEAPYMLAPAPRPPQTNFNKCHHAQRWLDFKDLSISVAPSLTTIFTPPSLKIPPKVSLKDEDVAHWPATDLLPAQVYKLFSVAASSGGCRRVWSYMSMLSLATAIAMQPAAVHLLPMACCRERAKAQQRWPVNSLQQLGGSYSFWIPYYQAQWIHPKQRRCLQLFWSTGGWTAGYLSLNLLSQSDSPSLVAKKGDSSKLSSHTVKPS